SFKLRGAMNKSLILTPEELQKGIVTASSGNHGRALSHAAKMLDSKAIVVVPDTTPAIKINAIKDLGAEVVLSETSVRFKTAEKISEETGGTYIHPYNDYDVMAGQGTIGLEIMKQQPDLDIVIFPTSGGGLIGGASTAIKGMDSNVKVYGAEPSQLPRYTKSLEEGIPTAVPQKPTKADALVSQAPGSKCFPVVRDNVDGILDVDDDYMFKGMKLLLTEGKVFGEPSGCIGIGAVLQGLIKFKETDKVCFVITGGNAGLEQLDVLKEI
ncbi:MAG: threonine/serine dehydratase, partial [Gallicola sp.]|nr:threonine/serine dehydratase [Gallicola sp.]